MQLDRQDTHTRDAGGRNARIAKRNAGSTLATLAVLCGAAAIAPTAWAAETATGAVADASADHYQVAYRFMREGKPGSAADAGSTMQLDLPVRVGSTTAFGSEAAGFKRCQLGVELQAMKGDVATLRLPFACDDAAPAAPRLMMRLGEPGTIRQTPDGAGGASITIVATVTRWPADKPWPGP